MKKFIALLISFALCFSLSAPAFASPKSDADFAQTVALNLKSLSLFTGLSDTNLDLNRQPTKAEAVTMLIRMLGKESTAKNGSWQNDFTDVAPWASSYIGYAHSAGLVNGISATEFGSAGNVTAQTFLTLTLRALGYSDNNGADFTYSDPFTLAKKIGILPSFVDASDFQRSDAVIIMYAALGTDIKGTTGTLADKLISDGVFTKAQFDSVYDKDAISKEEKAEQAASTDTPSGTVLTSEQIYAKCSPAVFYIEVYNMSGKATASGSGFFIDANGTAVTNFHVIKGAYSAKITTSDTQQTYDVAGVYDYSSTSDWAVLKINGSGFKYLNIGDAGTVVGGASVCAIGSPLGLQNTITEGIISNTARDENGVKYIQTSAAISHGSSGGALINKYGSVIGITSGSYTDGQNLNLALPISSISGYKTASVTTLTNLAGGAKSTEYMSSAIASLKSFLMSNGTYSSSIGGYFITQTKGNVQYSIIYLPDDGTLFTLDTVVNKNGRVDTTIFLDSSASSGFMIKTNLANGYKLEGEGTIVKSSFNLKTQLDLSAYTGEASLKEYLNTLCPISVCCLLGETEDLLEQSGAPVNIGDLGFSTIYSELTA